MVQYRETFNSKTHYSQDYGRKKYIFQLNLCIDLAATTKSTKKVSFNLQAISSVAKPMLKRNVSTYLQCNTNGSSQITLGSKVITMPDVQISSNKLTGSGGINFVGLRQTKGIEKSLTVGSLTTRNTNMLASASDTASKLPLEGTLEKIDGIKLIKFFY